MYFIGISSISAKSKGGGLSATFGGGNQVMGVKKTADFLEKSTWYLAIAFWYYPYFPTSLFQSRRWRCQQLSHQEQLDETPIPAQTIPTTYPLLHR